MALHRLAPLLLLLALGLLALPSAAAGALRGTHHASRAYLVNQGPKAGELTLRVVARYPARPSALGRGPFFGFVEVVLRGPGGALRVHDLDRLEHPRHAQQVDHRIEITRSRTRALLGSRGRNAKLTIATRFTVLGPLARDRGLRQPGVRAKAPAPVPLLWVNGSPPLGGILGGTNSWLRIGYSLDPNRSGSYDTVVTEVAPSLVSPFGETLMTDLTVPGNGVLRVSTPDGLAPSDVDSFSATFSITAKTGLSRCPGAASGTISGIEGGYADTFDFWNASYVGNWSTERNMTYATCAYPISGTMSTVAGSTGVWTDAGP